MAETQFKCGNIITAALQDSMSHAILFFFVSLFTAVAVYVQLPSVTSALHHSAAFTFIPSSLFAAAIASGCVFWLWAFRRLAEGYRLPANLHPIDHRSFLFKRVEAVLSLSTPWARLFLLPPAGGSHQQQQQQQLQQLQQQQQHMKGKVCAITGANSGIGREVAMQLSAWGARVALLCRNEEQGRALAGLLHRQQLQRQQQQQQLEHEEQQEQQQQQQQDPEKCGSACSDGCIARFIRADLCSLESLRAAAEELEMQLLGASEAAELEAEAAGEVRAM